MSFIFEPMTTAGLFIHGSEHKFPVRRIYCVGRNYAAHAREMGFDPDREPPFFFCKPNDLESVVPVNTDAVDIPYPSETSNFHYEIELVVAIGKNAKNVSVEDAVNYIYGYAVGLDMTRRDLQMAMREKGRPWEIGKAFDFSAPVGPIHPITQTGEINNADIHLTVNGKTEQHSDVSQVDNHARFQPNLNRPSCGQVQQLDDGFVLQSGGRGIPLEYHPRLEYPL